MLVKIKNVYFFISRVHKGLFFYQSSSQRKLIFILKTNCTCKNGYLELYPPELFIYRYQSETENIRQTSKSQYT